MGLPIPDMKLLPACHFKWEERKIMENPDGVACWLICVLTLFRSLWIKARGKRCSEWQTSNRTDLAGSFNLLTEGKISDHKCLSASSHSENHSWRLIDLVRPVLCEELRFTLVFQAMTWVATLCMQKRPNKYTFKGETFSWKTARRRFPLQLNLGSQHTRTSQTFHTTNPRAPVTSLSSPPILHWI